MTNIKTPKMTKAKSSGFGETSLIAAKYLQRAVALSHWLGRQNNIIDMR
jgi:hypothetical protein